MNDKEYLSELKKQQEKIEKQAAENRAILMQMVEKGELPKPRPLTRAERKTVDALGLNTFKVKSDDKRPIASIREDLGDWIIDNMFKDFDFGNLPNNVALWFTDYIFSISYRDDLSEKN